MQLVFPYQLMFRTTLLRYLFKPKISTTFLYVSNTQPFHPNPYSCLRDRLNNFILTSLPSDIAYDPDTTGFEDSHFAALSSGNNSGNNNFDI